MKKDAITFLGVGDVVIENEHPEESFRNVAKVLGSADIVYAN